MSKSKVRVHKRGSLLISLVLTALLGLGGLIALYLTDANREYPGVNLSVDAVSCADAADAADTFATAVAEAKKAPPSYESIKKFGFSTPATPAEVEALLQIVTTRQAQLDAKAIAAKSGTCVDVKSASVVDADGTTKNLPLVSGDQPLMPVSASESNDDPRTVPVTIGTPGNDTITNKWTDLNDLYGTTQWYVDCANANLMGMNWNNDVPKFIASEEAGQDSRFILAVNTDSSLDDDEIRRQAAASNNTDTADLKVVRTPAIINTRHLEDKRCSEFVHTRSQIRISLGRLLYDEAGNFKSVEMTQGTFVDCHNLWRLPKSITPTPTPNTPGATPPPTTTTTPPATCTPPLTGTPPNCLQPKNAGDGAAARGNVPVQVQGTNPAPAATAENRPADPPATYNPPAPPPPVATTAPAPARTTVPPAPPKANPTTPFDPCNPVTPACG